ncbi:hypothetical protein DSECCO2_434740 [anaerobic digester metagenome]
MNPADLLSLPTDSLYKFMALSGLAITVLALILPEIFKKNYSFLVYKVRMVHDVSLEKENDFKRRTKNYSEKQNKTQDEIEKYEKEFLQIRCARLEIEKDIKEIEYLVSKIKIITFVQLASVLIGLAMAISGFYLWYTKLQFFLDSAIASKII